MIKLYKHDADDRLLYREAWVASPHVATVHHGIVGRELGVAAVNSFLRAARLDLSRARIATRGALEEEYVLEYSEDPVPDFSIW